MEFKIVRENIINTDTDAIVLPANEKLKEGSGTSRVIFSAAGRKNLKDACSKIGSCEVGTAVPTSGYKLDADYIIHAIVPKWIDGEHNEYELLSSAYFSALSVADSMKCESIAFPLLSAGNNGFDRELAFNIAKESIEEFDGKYLKKVMLVVYDAEIAVFLKTKGYDVLDYIRISQKEKKEKRKESMDNAIKTGKQFMCDHKKEMIDYGIDIANKVFQLIKENKKES